MSIPEKGISALRRNRIAQTGARYFITAVTLDRKRGLANEMIWQRLNEVTGSSSVDIYAMVVMPDHLHLLFELPQESKPGDIVRSIKGPLSPILRRNGLAWQKNYFERRLRETESTERYLRYMLSNPYRAGLLNLSLIWPYWKVTSAKIGWFIDKFPKQTPEAEWLMDKAPWIES